MKTIMIFSLLCLFLFLLSSCNDVKTRETTVITMSKDEALTQGENPSWPWPEPNPEIDKNRNLILNAFPENIFTEYLREATAQRVAQNVAQGLADFLYQLEIPELKKVEVVRTEESVYVVRFVDINDEAYTINIDKRHGGGPRWTVWKEDENGELEIFRAWGE